MKTLAIEFPNQTQNGKYRAVIFEGFDVADIAEANSFTSAADIIMDLHPDAILSDEAAEQVMVEGMFA